MNYLFDSYNWDFSDPNSIPNLFIDHVSITVVSLLIALVVAFPIALLITRYKRLYLPVITAAGIIYTIPSLALFAFLVPTFGLNPPSLLIPLVLYAQIVLIRNIAAAIGAVDPTLVEVGRAMGMNSAQLFLRVTLPLALPIIVAGIRVTTVTTIGIATLGPLIGVEDLGFIIIEGRSFGLNPGIIGTGAFLVTVLALGADLLLLGLQRFLSRGQSIAVRA